MRKTTNPRRNKLQVMLTDDELTKLKQLAEGQGLDLSSFVRQSVLYTPNTPHTKS